MQIYKVNLKLEKKGEISNKGKKKDRISVPLTKYNKYKYNWETIKYGDSNR